MRILITNDDGIHASQLMPLARWARKLGEVTVVAPDREKSGASQSIQLHQPFAVERQDWDEGITAYAIGTSPADCVRFALFGMQQRYDLVISGINRGFNMGTDIMYSGTAGAAFEAALQKIPAVAISTSPEYYEQALEQLDRVFDFIRRHRLLERHPAYNINIPPEGKSICITRQGGKYYSDNFVPVEDGLYKASGYCVYQQGEDLTLDTDAVMSGHISVMPLTIDRTALDVYKAIAALAE